jgi:hypothetical protein
MKAATATQMLNAEADKAPAAWIVLSGFNATDLKASAPMTYRQAKAAARAMREACGYAIVQRAA